MSGTPESSTATAGSASASVHLPARPSADSRWVWAGGVTSAVAALALVAALGGLLLGDLYGEPAGTAQMLRGFDVVTLVVVVPALVWSLLAARQGWDRAVLVWVGMVACLVYTYAFYVFAVPFTDLFLVHVAVFSGAMFALVLTLTAVDGRGIAERFSQRTPRRAVAAVLGVLAVSLGGMWVYACVRVITSGELPVGSALVESDAVVQFGIAMDLAVLVPSYAVAAVLLWRRIAAGKVLATVLLVAGSVHQISYLVALPMQSTAGVPDAVPFDPVEPVIALLYLGATGAMLTAAGRRPPSVPC